MWLLLGLIVSLCCSSSSSQSQHIGQQRLSDQTKSALFEIERVLNFSSAAPHIFSSIHGLLRRGYNTFFPNGYTVAPCEIPAFTPLYHGWLSDEAPHGPEWLAFAPDVAYAIMGSTRNSFLSTYQTTRPTKCLYFDGASAALWGNGTMDTQMLLIYGNTTGVPTKSRPVGWEEHDRAQGLCGWIHEQQPGAFEQGIEGIVRMNAGLELIWCNFSSPSLRLTSRLNISVPLLDYDRTPVSAKQIEKCRSSSPPFNHLASADTPYPKMKDDCGREPFLVSQYWDMFSSASRSYNAEDLASSRETAIKVLGGELVSFYSSEYQTFSRTIAGQEKEQLNLTSDGMWKGVYNRQERGDALLRLMRRRSKHRVGDISPSDVAKFHQSLKSIVSTLSQPAEKRSETNQIDRSIPWSTVHDLVVESYSKRLIQFRQLLEQNHDRWTGSWITAREYFALLRERSHAFLMPYMEYPTDPLIEVSSEQGSQVRKHALERCSSAYLPWSVKPAHGEPPQLMDHSISRAIEEVMEGICSVLISVGYSIEVEWSQSFNRIPDEDDEWEEPLLASLLASRDKIEELTAWLGWAPHWTRCDRLCDWDEECYIPIWPAFRQMRIGTRVYEDFSYIDPQEVEHDLWHPKCLKITDFPSHWDSAGAR